MLPVYLHFYCKEWITQALFNTGNMQSSTQVSLLIIGEYSKNIYLYSVLKNQYLCTPIILHIYPIHTILQYCGSNSKNANNNNNK